MSLYLRGNKLKQVRNENLEREVRDYFRLHLSDRNNITHLLGRALSFLSPAPERIEETQ